MRYCNWLLVIAVLAGAAAAYAQSEPAATTAPAQQGPGYHVIKKIAVGGEGGWDFLTVDSDTSRLFIPRSDRVMVLDLSTEKVVGTIPDTAGVHGVGLAGDCNRGYTTNGKANTTTIFDLKTLKVLGTVETGTKPDAIVYDTFTHRMFICNGGSKNLTVIDAAAGKVVGTIDLGGAPEVAVVDGSGHLYVNLEDKSEVVAVDTVKMAVLAHWPLEPGKAPSGLAIDVKNRRLFSGCAESKTMEVLDIDTGKVLASLPIGARVDGAGFDPVSGDAFSSNGEGTITVVHEESPEKFAVAQTVPTQGGAKTMTLDPKTHLIYTATCDQPHPRNEPVKNFVVLVVGK